MTNSQIQLNELQHDSLTMEELVKDNNIMSSERDSLLKSKRSLDQIKLARAQSDPLSPSKQGLKEEEEDPDFGNEDENMGTDG